MNVNTANDVKFGFVTCNKIDQSALCSANHPFRENNIRTRYDKWYIDLKHEVRQANIMNGSFAFVKSK